MKCDIQKASNLGKIIKSVDIQTLEELKKLDAEFGCHSLVLKFTDYTNNELENPLITIHDDWLY